MRVLFAYSDYDELIRLRVTCVILRERKMPGRVNVNKVGSENDFT